MEPIHDEEGVKNKEELSPKARKIWKWIGLGVGCLMMSVAGTQYMFSVYAPQLKERIVKLGYTQPEINLVGTFGNFGIYFGGVLPGLFFDKYGARLTCLLGSILMFGGYFLMYIGATNPDLPGIVSSFLSMSFFLALMGIGSSACYTAALGTNVLNSNPKHVGFTVGALVSFFGLCAAIFTELYSALFKPNVMQLLLFLSITLATVCGLGILFLRVLPPVHEETANSSRETNLLLNVHQQERDFTYLQMLKTVDFWLVLIVFGMVSGAGFVIFNNLGGLVIALGGTAGDQDKFVIVLSGRIITGVTSDRFSHRLSRPWFFLFGSSLMCISHFYFAFCSTPESLYPGVIGVGLSYGCMMSVAPTFTGEFFGKTHFGGNWALMRVSPGVGSFLCSTVITGQLYQLAIKEEGETQCIGQQCFQLALFIMFGISFICAVATLLIIKRARLFYFKHDAALKEDKSTIAVDPDPHNEDDTPSLS